MEKKKYKLLDKINNIKSEYNYDVEEKSKGFELRIYSSGDVVGYTKDLKLAYKILKLLGKLNRRY